MFAYDHLQAHPHELVDNVYNVVDIVDMGTGDVVDDFTTVHDDPPPCENVLVHREANDKVVITDIRVTVTHRTNRKVDIKGIDRHTVNGVYISTAGSVVTTEKVSVVILVFHQYALLGKGRTIHTHGQLQWYDNDVNDKSNEVHRQIKPHNGFGIPLVFDGLSRLCIHPFSNDDWEKSLHVNLTDKSEVDPTVLDYYDQDEHEGWFDTTNDIELSPSVTHSDVFCQYRRRVTDQRTECLRRNVVVVPPTSCTSTIHEPDCSALRPVFGRVEPTVSKETPEHTIRLARSPMGTTLIRTFILINPAILVYRRPEYVVCDEVYSDATTIEDDADHQVALTDEEDGHSTSSPVVAWFTRVVWSIRDRGQHDQQVDNDPPSSSTSSDHSVIHSEDLVGRTFLLDKQDDGTIPRTQTIEMIKGSPMVGKDEKQKIIAFNNLLNCLLRDEQASSVPRQIILYQHVDRIHPDNRSSINIMATWKNGEITPKPPTIVAADDPVTCAIYSYGFAIPKSNQHTISLVRNSNTTWFDVIAAVSLAQVDMYATPDDASAFSPPKVGYRQSRTVADGHPIDAPSEVVHSGSVSLHGVHLVLTTTELNGITTLSMGDFTIPKRDPQATTMLVVHTAPSVQEQSSIRLDCSSSERGVGTTGVDTALGFGRFTVNPEPSNVRMVPIDGELPHPRKHVKFQISSEPNETNADPPSELQSTSFGVGSNIQFVIKDISQPFVSSDTSNFAVIWPILIIRCQSVKKFAFSKQGVAVATDRPAPVSVDTSVIDVMFTVHNVIAHRTPQDTKDTDDLLRDTPDSEVACTATSSNMSLDLNGVPQDTHSTSNLTHAWRLCSLQTSPMFRPSAMDWTKFQEPTPWIPLSIQDDKAILATLDLLLGSIPNYSLSTYLSCCSSGSSSRIGYYRHVKHIVGLQPPLCYMDNHLSDESCSKYIVGDKEYSVYQFSKQYTDCSAKMIYLKIIISVCGKLVE